jgi:molecular chaperone GrpE
MSDKFKRNRDSAEHASPGAEQPADPELTPEELAILAENEAEGGLAEDPLMAARAENAELRDQLLRALAETENVRQRARREREEALKYATAPFARDLLTVADNLRRALESVPDGLSEDEGVKTLLTGVEMTERALQDAFSKHAIRQIDPIGEKLDPHAHEAMVEVLDPSRVAGTVSQVFERGYALHDRLLRPARVGVAKGGPAQGADPAKGPAPGPGSKLDTEA